MPAQTVHLMLPDGRQVDRSSPGVHEYPVREDKHPHYAYEGKHYAVKSYSTFPYLPGHEGEVIVVDLAECKAPAGYVPPRTTN